MNTALPQFVDDQRAVSAVIGFILVFGLLMLTLTVYQAAIVPQQNAQTEFQHFEEVRDELIQLRNSISTAGQTDVSQFPSVTLGTNYRTRTLTINPPAPAGTLQTSDAYNITISNGTEEFDTNITTRFLEYQPGYNEIIVGPTRFEHSVLYLDERERGNGISIIEDQNIVKDGTVRITALQNQFQKTSTGRVTLELYPQDELNESDFPDPNGAELTVTVPTRLNESNYWDEALADSGDIYQGVDSGSNINKLNLSVNEADLEVNTVGIRGEPDEGPGKNVDPYAGDGSGGGSDSGGAADAIQVTPDVRSAGNSGKYEFGLENTGNIDVEIVAIGINETSDSGAEKVDAKDGGDSILTEDTEGQIVDTVIDFDSSTPDQADRYDFTTNIEIVQNNDRTFEFERFLKSNNKNAKMKGDSVTITIWFSDGTSSTLLLDPNA